MFCHATDVLKNTKNVRKNFANMIKMHFENVNFTCLFLRCQTQNV